MAMLFLCNSTLMGFLYEKWPSLHAYSRIYSKTFGTFIWTSRLAHLVRSEISLERGEISPSELLKCSHLNTHRVTRWSIEINVIPVTLSFCWVYSYSVKNYIARDRTYDGEAAVGRSPPMHINANTIYLT